MNWVLVLGVLFTSLSSAAQSESELKKLYEIQSPRIIGNVLYIRGRIDSHIYDFLAYEHQRIQKEVEIIDLQSFGGNALMGLDVAEKIKSLNKTTRVTTFCASACVPLFAAGTKRVMASEAWIGIHAARLGGSYQIEFESACKVLNADSAVVVDENKPGCSDFLAKWYARAYEITDRMFLFYESQQVSLEMRQDYFDMPLDLLNWHNELNVMKTPDWVVDSPMAKSYNLATQVIPQSKF